MDALPRSDSGNSTDSSSAMSSISSSSSFSSATPCRAATNEGLARRLRQASDLEQRGVLDSYQKYVLKDLLVQGDQRVAEAFTRYYNGEGATAIAALLDEEALTEPPNMEQLLGGIELGDLDFHDDEAEGEGEGDGSEDPSSSSSSSSTSLAAQLGMDPRDVSLSPLILQHGDEDELLTPLPVAAAASPSLPAPKTEPQSPQLLAGKRTVVPIQARPASTTTAAAAAAGGTAPGPAVPAATGPAPSNMASLLAANAAAAAAFFPAGTTPMAPMLLPHAAMWAAAAAAAGGLTPQQQMQLLRPIPAYQQAFLAASMAAATAANNAQREAAAAAASAAATAPTAEAAAPVNHGGTSSQVPTAAGELQPGTQPSQGLSLLAPKAAAAPAAATAGSAAGGTGMPTISTCLNMTPPAPICIPCAGVYIPAAQSDKRYIGAYSPTARRRRIERYLEKREKRCWLKRKRRITRNWGWDHMIRVRGRFVRKGPAPGTAEAAAEAAMREAAEEEDEEEGEDEEEEDGQVEVAVEQQQVMMTPVKTGALPPPPHFPAATPGAAASGASRMQEEEEEDEDAAVDAMFFMEIEEEKGGEADGGGYKPLYSTAAVRDDDPLSALTFDVAF